MWGVRSIETLFQDLRYGARMLLKSKIFTTVAALSLALGIGANTAIFSLINALLMKRLPVQDPEQLVLLTIADRGSSGASFSYPLYEQFRDRTHSLVAAGDKRIFPKARIKHRYELTDRVKLPARLYYEYRLLATIID